MKLGKKAKKSIRDSLWLRLNAFTQAGLKPDSHEVVSDMLSYLEGLLELDPKHFEE